LEENTALIQRAEISQFEKGLYRSTGEIRRGKYKEWGEWLISE